MKKKTIQGFKSPPAVYRSAPFWSWNDKLEQEELCSQVDMMQKGGFGGGFMHSRMGLITPYLSEEWIKCIKETVKYAVKKGFKAYLYDEDRCSSGFASGIVTKNPRNRMRYLLVEKKGKNFKYSVVFGEPTEWYNGSTYVDILNKDTVGEFMSSTYALYKKSAGRYFGDAVPAIFTDEPNYYRGNLYNWGKKKGNLSVLPWTLDFEKIFTETYGYDILEKVSFLVEKEEGYEKVRYDYFRLLTRLLLENFGRQVYDWCGKNNISLTGHYMGEGSLHSQITNIGEAMCMYEYMHWPGIDYLGKETDNPLIPLQCSSVANQLGKERVLSELYGCSGQDFSLAGRKRVGDWHIALGVNFFCPHLYLYSLRGCRKRDYPPTISHHQPYWVYGRELEDYFARSNFLMSSGRSCANVLVIHPVESGWCVYGEGKKKKADRLLESGWISEGNSGINDIDRELAMLARLLLEKKFDFDFGSEHLVEKYGKSEKEVLKVSRGTYSAVVIPPALTLRKKNAELLARFGKKGGKIFASVKFPHLLEGEKPSDTLLDDLRKVCVIYDSLESLAGFLEKSVERKVTVKDGKGLNIPEILVSARDMPGEEETVFFLVNTSGEKGFSATAEICTKGKVFKADAFTGDIREIPVSYVNEGRAGIELYFPPCGSHMLVASTKGKPLLAQKKKLPVERKEKLVGWEIALKNFNILVLDRCRLKESMEDGWSKTMLVIKCQELLEKILNKQRVCMLFEFEVEKGFIPGGLKLIIEDAERYGIRINGKPLAQKNCGSWPDKSFDILDIPRGFIASGKNSILLETIFVPPKKKGTLIFKEGGTEIENIYIAGNFAVRAKTVKKEEKGYFHKGLSIAPASVISDGKDINLQGCPFYTGILAAEKKISFEKLEGRYFLQFDEFRCVSASVRVNGKPAGVVCLPPYRLDITGFLEEGENIISAECANTLRNLFGPFHQKNMNPSIVGPGSFEDFETEAYSNVPFGIGKAAIIQSL